MQFQNAWLGLMEGMEIEAKALETGVRLNPNAWPWTRVINGRAHCTLRVSGRIMELDDEGHRAVIVESIEKAAEWYRKELVKVQDEQYHERIRPTVGTTS